MRRWSLFLLLSLFACKAKATAPQYETVAADEGRIVSRVTATGVLSALVTVQVGSQVSGRIKSLHADFNSKVEKGQLLAVLDPQLFQAALDQSRANHAAARANLTMAAAEAKNATKQAERSKALAEQKLIAPADYENVVASADVATARVESARAALRQAEAALEQAQVNFDYTMIRSPIDGIVISRDVDVGQTVAASLQAPVLFVLAEDLSRMQVDCSVSEADVGKLHDGMPASFTVDAFTGERFSGTVRQIRNAATTVQNVVTYNAVIDVENPELKLKPGMTANATFVVAERPKVLRVPNAALRFRPAGEVEPPEGRVLYRLEGGRPVRVPVELGITDGRHTEVKSGGLGAGDRVITGTLNEAPTGGRPRGPRIL